MLHYIMRTRLQLQDFIDAQLQFYITLHYAYMLYADIHSSSLSYYKTHEYNFTDLFTTVA